MKRLVFCLLLAACSTAPESKPLPKGTDTAPPQGYVEFCEREPEQC